MLEAFCQSVKNSGNFTSWNTFALLMQNQLQTDTSLISKAVLEYQLSYSLNMHELTSSLL
jgi:hypothetical protein